MLHPALPDMVCAPEASEVTVFPCEMRAASGRCKAAHQRCRHTAAAEPHTAEVPPPSSRLQACRRVHELWRLQRHGHRKAPGQSVVVGEGRDDLKEEVAAQAMLLAEQSDKIITYEDEIIRQVHCTLHQCPAIAKHRATHPVLPPRTRLQRQDSLNEPCGSDREPRITTRHC